MFGTTNFALFVVAGLLLNITPGPDTLYIVGRAASHGWRGGAIAALGISTGLLVHTFIAAIGLSALLAASATAFAIVKWIGAGYLMFIGASLLFGRSSNRPSPSAQQATKLTAVFLQGFLTNVLNPKVALFFLAFLPQFVDPGAINKPLALMFLGIVFIFNGTLWNLFVAWSAAHVVNRLKAFRYFAHWVNRSVGAVFVYLGVRLALLDKH
jgi:threonine/homoserine/homoserine lactone efflux protein